MPKNMRKNEPRNKAQSKEELEHDAQRKYIQLQLIKQQVQTFAEEKKAIDEKVEELNQTVDTLKKLHGISGDTEMWTPLGSGTFVRSELKDAENVLIGIGAGAAVNEKRERAAELLEERKKELENIGKEVMTQIFELTKSAESIEEDLNRIIEKFNK